MKKRLLSILLTMLMVLCTAPFTAFAETGDVAINETNFPDANFRKIVEGYDTTKADGTVGADGVLSAAELEAVDEIECYDSGIANLKGIEYFTELTYLDCSNDDDSNKNTLTSLDLSKNTKLEYLYCYDNAITSLDLSSNTNLILVNCSDNALTSLKLGNNTSLIDLSCSDNALTSLDVSKNTGLKFFNCDGNKLTTLDVSNNTKLGESYGSTDTQADGGLHCAKNNLTSLDVSKCENLSDEDFDCTGNTYKITAVNGVFNLKDLPGDFDLNNVVADSWVGATVKDGKLIIDSKTNKVTYSYYCGSDKSKEVEFTLLVTHTTKSDDAKSPATGDNNELGLFAFAGLISAVGVAFVLRRKHSM